MSRSGTTLLSRMLDAHSKIAILPETWWYVVLDRLGCLREFSNPWQSSLFFNEVWGNLRSYRDPAARIVANEAARQSRYVGPTSSLLEKLGKAYASERGAQIWGEKTPGHALWLPQMRDLFPQARVLFMVRDPRDVLVSYDDRWDQGRRDTEYIVSTAALLKYFLVRLLQSPSFAQEQIRWVRYESLTAQPLVEMEQICKFLGVDFEPSMLDFYRAHENVEQEMADGRFHARLSRPATTEQIGRYKKEFTPTQVALIEQLLGEHMRSLGYPLSDNEGIAISSENQRMVQKAEAYYQQMLSGEIRKRFRRKGWLKLHAYQIFGRMLDLVPSWRIAKTEEDWRLRAQQDLSPVVPPVASESLNGGVAPEKAEKPNFRTEMGRISRQSSVVFGGTIFTATLGYAFKVYLARALGAQALGVYALGMTITSFLGVLAVMGLPESVVRFVAVYSASKKVDALRALLWNVSWVLMAANLLFAAVLLTAGPWFAVRFYHSPQLVRYLPLYVPILFTSTLNTFFGDVLSGYREVGRRTMITKFVASPVSMVVAVLLITLGAGLGGYLAAQIVSAVVVLALLISLVWRMTPAAARTPDLKRLSIAPEVWSFSAAMFGVGMMQFLMGQTDRVVLGVYRGAHDVGIYTVAAALIAYETIVLQSVNQIFSPVIADIHARQEHVLLGRLFQTLTKWILGLTFPLAIVMILYSRPIMRMFGHDFEAGWPILVIGTFGQLVNCGVGSVGYLLLMSGNQRRLVRLQVGMAAVMVVLSFELIPLWGVLGAAIAAAITNIGMNVWSLMEVRKALKLSPYNRSFLKLLPSIVSSLLIVLLLRRVVVPQGAVWAVILATLLLAYAAFVVAALAMGLDEDDRLISDAAWGKIRGFLGR